MQLIELVLHNVGVYHGRQVIHLATTSERPVVLIGGLNGCGKTTLLDALQLVLYGNRARLSNRGTQGYEDFLRETISRKARPEDGASISLTFDVDTEGERRRYRVDRSWAVAGKRVRESLDVFLDGEWNRNLSTGWSDHVEELLPLEIASLFFFDGEKIEALADPERAASVIQTAVHSLLGISTLEQLRTDLLALQRRQVPPGADAALDQRVADLSDEHQRIQDQLDEITQRRGHVRQELALAEKTAETARQAYARDGGVLFEQRVALQTERDGTCARLENVRSQLRTLAEGPLPLSLLRAQLAEIAVQSEHEAANREAERIVELLRERDAWLLERLPATSRARADKLLREDRDRRGPVNGVDAYLNLTDDAREQLRQLPTRLDEATTSAARLLGEAAELKELLDQLDSKLAGIPHEDQIAQLQNDLETAQMSCARLQGQLSVLDEDLDRLRRERTHAEEQLSRAEAERLRASVEREDVQRIVVHTERVRETLAALRERLILRHISKIEIATLDSFRRLMRKDGLVADLRIDPDTYAIRLSAASGQPIAPSRLSAGERQLLAVALLWGLARVAGNRLPTVIDTPLGRLDSRHRRHLVDRYFPHAAGQVLLLSTDEEIDRELLRRLSPAIGQAYVLDHDDAEHVTTVRTGYWWPLEVHDVA